MKITLIETRKGCAILERTPRYHVMFDGKFYGELYYNMTGYVGYLPSPKEDGTIIPMNIGECGISAFRKEVARLNKEWKAFNGERTVIQH